MENVGPADEERGYDQRCRRTGTRQRFKVSPINLLSAAEDIRRLQNYVMSHGVDGDDRSDNPFSAIAKPLASSSWVVDSILNKEKYSGRLSMSNLGTSKVFITPTILKYLIPILS